VRRGLSCSGSHFCGFGSGSRRKDVPLYWG
jgi:hypothetical protein